MSTLFGYSDRKNLIFANLVSKINPLLLILANTDNGNKKNSSTFNQALQQNRLELTTANGKSWILLLFIHSVS